MVLSASYYGASLDRDSWVVITGTLLLLSQLIFGPLHETFRSRFSFLKETYGIDHAVKASMSVVSLAFIICLALMSVLIFYPSPLLSVVAPGYDVVESAHLRRMLMVLAPSLVLTELAVLGTAILNSFERFYLPDTVALFPPMAMVLCMVALDRYVGIMSLVIGLYSGNLIVLFVLAHGLKKRVVTGYRLELPRKSLWLPFVSISIPLFVSYGVGQAQQAFERALCTILGVGSASILDYARKFIDMPIAVILGTLSTILTPVLAISFARGDVDSFERQVFKFLRMFALGIVPIVSVFIYCPDHLVNLVLRYGAFSDSFVEPTQEAIRWYGIGALAIAFYGVASQAIIARQRYRLYATIGTCGLLVAIVIGWLFFRIWREPGLAMAWTVGHVLAALWYSLAAYRGLSSAKGQLLRIFAITIGTLGLTFGATLLVGTLVLPVSYVGSILMLSTVAIVSIAGVIGGIFVFQLDEKTWLQNLARHLVSRP